MLPKVEEDSYKVRVPLSVEMDSKRVKELENGLKIVKGAVNGNEAWVLRDTGCTTVCMSKEFAKKLGLKSNDEKLITLANGSECICHETEIDLDSPYLTGTVMALIMDCPVADIIIGEIAYMKVSQSSIEIVKNLAEECKIESKMFSDRCTDKSDVGSKDTEQDMNPGIVSEIETISKETLREEDESKQGVLEEGFIQENSTAGKHESSSYTLENCVSRMGNLKDQHRDSTITKVRMNKLSELAEIDDLLGKKSNCNYFYHKNKVRDSNVDQNDIALR